MKKSPANDFFDQIDYESIVENIKGIYSSDGSMSVLMDFERCLDQANLYAFKNWELGELVAGPIIKKYSVICTFMYPAKFMPDPRGLEKITMLGCNVAWKKTKLRCPVKVRGYDDFVSRGPYPRAYNKSIWLIRIEMPKELMDEVKEGSIQLAGQSIDLKDLEEAYMEDLDKADMQEDQKPEQGAEEAVPMGMPSMGGPPGGMPQL
jgi:hypothetical protein